MIAGSILCCMGIVSSRNELAETDKRRQDEQRRARPHGQATRSARDFDRFADRAASARRCQDKDSRVAKVAAHCCCEPSKPRGLSLAINSRGLCGQSTVCPVGCIRAELPTALGRRPSGYHAYHLGEPVAARTSWPRVAWPPHDASRGADWASAASNSPSSLSCPRLSSLGDLRLRMSAAASCELQLESRNL